MEMQGFCEVITYTIHCDGSCAAAGYGECDGFACPTGECIHQTVSWDYCGSGSGSSSGDGGFNGGLGSGNTGVGTGNNGGGGITYQGIYIPLPYSGEEDLNNADFILTCQTAAFINGQLSVRSEKSDEKTKSGKEIYKTYVSCIVDCIEFIDGKSND